MVVASQEKQEIQILAVVAVAGDHQSGAQEAAAELVLLELLFFIFHSILCYNCYGEQNGSFCKNKK
jgi:Na+/alanine symporter